MLQNLRGVAADFDKWYTPYCEEMKQDELMRFFWDLRNASLHRGEDGISSVIVRPARGGMVSSSSEGIAYTVTHADGREETGVFPAPPDAVRSFFGDIDGGGSGWIVRDADGKETKQYVPIPREAMETSLEFANPPRTHLGQPIEDRSARNLCALYVAYLRRMVADAEKHFG